VGSSWRRGECLVCCSKPFLHILSLAMQSAGLHRLRPKMMYTVPTLLLELVLDNSMSRQVAEAKPADGRSCAAETESFFVSLK
jgi:hypothetical protein